ncbi:hypothetical protein BXZ70DRAFT_947092 [Cristinia sonorae]|uniref:Uncharacterized protein n=1 Tax=Cristinia sonorae TaxID=1940300 RepID=A0A8K0XNH5_9AGAR|nr:hypothetical protein BXZ70DRAFT_947092 [Cristinia sonorae]
MRGSLFQFLVCNLLFVAIALADTEIINFDAVTSKHVDVAQSLRWFQLSEEPQNFHVLPAPLGTLPTDVCVNHNYRASGPCPHELWVMLDLDRPEWASFSKFTLRISWPANFPTQFKLQTYTPLQATSLLEERSVVAGNGSTTRTQYARIRLVDTGVRTPPIIDELPQKPVPFTVVLEPLHFGVLPKSVIPIIVFIIPVVLVSAYVVAPMVNTRLAAVAKLAREENTKKQL